MTSSHQAAAGPVLNLRGLQLSHKPHLLQLLFRHRVVSGSCCHLSPLQTCCHASCDAIMMSLGFGTSVLASWAPNVCTRAGTWHSHGPSL
jgi:hypothetical protein